VLNAKNSNSFFATDNRHARKTVKHFLAGFRFIGEVGMADCFVEVHGFDIGGDRADQPFSESQFRDVNRVLIQSAGGVKFQLAIAQQIDRADLAFERLADDTRNLVKLGLSASSRCHDLVKAGQYLAGGGGSR
jgi:hypothetical protein